MSRWWAWDLCPLEPGAWPNECVSIEGVQAGQSYENKRRRVDQRSVPYLGNIRAWYSGETEPVTVVSSRSFYRPTAEDVECIRSVIPGGEAENPSWHIIEAELVSGGLRRADLSAQKAPTLIRMLRNLKAQGRRAPGSSPGRRKTKRTSTARQRRQLPKGVETQVLTKSARRCCVCFGLHHDGFMKRGQIAHIDHDRDNNDPSNLAWLCLLHHDEYDSVTSQSKGFTSDEVKEYRERLWCAVEQGEFLDRHKSPRVANRGGPTFQISTRDNSTVISAARDVNFNVGGRRKAAAVGAPPDAIGSSIEMRSYVEYLIGRYIEWRMNAIKRGIDRRRFFPGIMNNLIKSKFGTRANLVPRSRFPEVEAFLQNAIDNTIWGKNNQQRNYRSFDEHCAQLRGTSSRSL